jgi:hypothetical protein
VAVVAVAVAGVIAEVALTVADDAEVAGGGAEVAARACRENSSKTAKMPAAKIATCTARRAMCRKIGSAIKQLPALPGDTNLAPTAHHPRPETYLDPLSCGHRELDVPPATYILYGHHRTQPAPDRQGLRMATELTTNPADAEG